MALPRERQDDLGPEPDLHGRDPVHPRHAPANYKLTAYVPRHAKPSSDGSGSHAVVQTASQTSSSSSHSHALARQQAFLDGFGGSGSAATLSGTLGCSGLEQLWEEAGGNPGEAFMAAEIAMAESGGYQYAHSPTDDFGYWQINAVNGSLATYDAYGNARAAVIISHDGTDWYPWTTYTSGAYYGRC